MAYDRLFIAGLEWLWGKGFLSPGGADEVSEILRATDLTGKTVLDIGCGIGGIDQLLVAQHGARKVVGIDVEFELIQRAIADARESGLESRIEYIAVAEGPLNFSGSRFDIVFSKDSIVHVKDKPALFREVFRVLRGGGVFVGSDWLTGEDLDETPAMREWLEIIGLEFALSHSSLLHSQLLEAGFEDVRLRDRNRWYRQAVRDEIARINGAGRTAFEAVVGVERAEHRFKSSSAKCKVVDEGGLRPTHFRAIKPAARDC